MVHGAYGRVQVLAGPVLKDQETGDDPQHAQELRPVGAQKLHGTSPALSVSSQILGRGKRSGWALVHLTLAQPNAAQAGAPRLEARCRLERGTRMAGPRGTP